MKQSIRDIIRDFAHECADIGEEELDLATHNAKIEVKLEELMEKLKLFFE